MSGNRNMFNILNTWSVHQALCSAPLHHTQARPSPGTAINWLRFRHFRHLAALVASRQAWLIAEQGVGSQASDPVNSHKILNTLSGD
jgi:hypothetical protein